ncbi:MAG TPA: LysR family transcriptional regulator [Pelomicrobium sp.]|nr:LysR family transcriptional regulator [Pelomicrobium sp.]
MDWDRLRVFYAVAESGSFTRAGRRLNLSQSAVSRQISGLEESLGVSLFHRHARGLVLTEQGQELFQIVEDVAKRLSLAMARINESREKPEGPLKITTTVTFGSAWLTSRLNQFHLDYPDIDVTLLLADAAELDLSSGHADMAIRFHAQTQPNLVQRRLMDIRYHLFASKDYLKAHPAPLEPADLDRHDLIVYGTDVPQPMENMNWILQLGAAAPRRPALTVNSVYGIYRAVRSGLGIAALPYYLSDESPDLVEVLPDVEGPSSTAYIVYPEELRHSKRIAVLRDFLIAQAEEDPRAVR